jgi:hypothetical protein
LTNPFEASSRASRQIDRQIDRLIDRLIDEQETRWKAGMSKIK